MTAPQIHAAESLRDALSKAASAKPPENEQMMKVLRAISELDGVTADVLTKTKLGKVVNLARKRPGVSAEAQALAKQLARGYKAIMDKAGPAKVSSGGSGADARRSSVSSVSSVGTAATSASGGSAGPALSVQHAKVDLDVPKVNNPARDTLRKVLCQALCTDGAHDAAGEVAAAIEQGCHDKHGANSKAKIRSIISNLKKNPDLRAGALSKSIPGERFAIMTSDDLASDRIKAINEAANKKFIEDHALAVKEGAHTTEYPCPKCRARDCIYTQLQTRSADEPMTTFCACNRCGNRWKFC